jgi:hypothetical protein
MGFWWNPHIRQFQINIHARTFIQSNSY